MVLMTTNYTRKNPWVIMGFVFHTNVNTMACAANMDNKETVARVVIVFARTVSVMKSYNDITMSDVDTRRGIENI